MTTVASTLVVRVVHDPREVDAVRLEAEGELDATSAASFRAAALQAVADGPARVVIELSGVRFLDSSGLRAVQTLQRVAAKAGIELALGGVSAAAGRVLTWMSERSHVERSDIQETVG